jgi:hypothetical protein
VAQCFFETGQDRFIVSSLDIDHSVRWDPGLCQRWGEQILAPHAPQHVAPPPRRNSGGEERSGSPVDRAISAAGHFVQCAERQAAIRQCSSMASMPNGNTACRCLTPPSRHRIRSRSASTLDCGQGLLLPSVVRWLGLARHAADEHEQEHKAELAARLEALKVAQTRLEHLAADREISPEVLAILRARHDYRAIRLPDSTSNELDAVLAAIT